MKHTVTSIGGDTGAPVTATRVKRSQHCPDWDRQLGDILACVLGYPNRLGANLVISMQVLENYRRANTKNLEQDLHYPMRRLSWLIVILCAVANLSIAGDSVIFEHIIVDQTAGDCKAAGDIDGNGLEDPVIGGGEDEALHWYRMPNLEKEYVATPDIEFTTDCALGDIDADGDLDIVVPDGPEGQNLLWFENPISSGWWVQLLRYVGFGWPRHEIGAIGSWGKDVELADYDSDGRLDVATRSRDWAGIFFQTPSGWQRHGFDVAEIGNEGLASGDIDQDGDTDIVLRGFWLANPGDNARNLASWKAFTIGPVPDAFKAVVADLDTDGLMDVVFSPAESGGDAVWWRQRPGGWEAHVLMSALDRAHTLDVGDIDGDDDLDVLLGEMHTSHSPARTLVLENVFGDGSLWKPHTVQQGVGLHNGFFVDLEHDGDADIVGANFTGNPPFSLWVNTRDPVGIPSWTHLTIGEDHERTFGLDCGDLNADGWPDILSGQYFYVNPGPPLTELWSRNKIPDGWHGILITNLDSDASSEILAQRSGQLAWFDVGDQSVNEIGSFPVTSHAEGSQGYAVGPILGEKNDIVIASGGGLYLFHPVDEKTWRRILVSVRPSDEGIGIADIDGNNTLDLIASTGEGREVEWYENPGNPDHPWRMHSIGSFPEAVYPDRLVVADFDGDGRPDVTVSEENGLPTGAQTFWWSNHADGWRRHLLTTQGSTNSMHVVDIDGDGDSDLITAEHVGRLNLTLWRNNGYGHFRPHLVDRGHENHLGALPCDLDGDQDFDLVGIGWNQPRYLHIWRNDSQARPDRMMMRQQ